MRQQFSRDWTSGSNPKIRETHNYPPAYRFEGVQATVQGRGPKQSKSPLHAACKKP